jgi:dephospho-CoA kinase
MIKLGLTGSIGMGKSTIAAMFADEGVPVWDADLTVHRLYAESRPVQDKLIEAFGDVIADGIVDRQKLSAALKGEAANFERLNAIVHPALADDRKAFFTTHKDKPLVLVDIPLLYEVGADSYLDKVLVVSAPADIQAARVLSRAGMTEAKFEAILSRQMPDAEKRAKADFVIDTSKSLDDCRDAVRVLIEKFDSLQIT